MSHSDVRRPTIPWWAARVLRRARRPPPPTHRLFRLDADFADDSQAQVAVAIQDVNPVASRVEGSACSLYFAVERGDTAAAETIARDAVQRWSDADLIVQEATLSPPQEEPGVKTWHVVQDTRPSLLRDGEPWGAARCAKLLPEGVHAHPKEGAVWSDVPSVAWLPASAWVVVFIAFALPVATAIDMVRRESMTSWIGIFLTLAAVACVVSLRRQRGGWRSLFSSALVVGLYLEGWVLARVVAEIGTVQMVAIFIGILLYCFVVYLVVANLKGRVPPRSAVIPLVAAVLSTIFGSGAWVDAMNMSFFWGMGAQVEAGDLPIVTLLMINVIPILLGVVVLVVTGLVIALQGSSVIGWTARVAFSSFAATVLLLAFVLALEQSYEAGEKVRVGDLGAARGAASCVQIVHGADTGIPQAAWDRPWVLVGSPSETSVVADPHSSDLYVVSSSVSVVPTATERCAK